MTKKNKNKENANNIKKDDDYIFTTQHDTHSCKWMMEAKTTKYMIF